MKNYLKISVLAGLTLLGILFISNCVNDSKGYDFNMQYEDGLALETDSIDVYIVWENDKGEHEELLYSGRKGDDGFEGPYSGTIEAYNGEDFKLRVIQYDVDGALLLDVAVGYNPDAEASDKDTLDDPSRDIETLISMTLLNDSAQQFGAFKKYGYVDGRLNKVEIYNGDLSNISDSEPSATIHYKYPSNTTIEKRTVTQTGEKTDSLFTYDSDGNLIKLDINGRGEAIYFLLKYEGGRHISTGRYIDEILDQFVKHSVDNDGRVTSDSVFSVETESNNLLRGFDYSYQNDGRLIKKLKWEIRAGGKEGSRSEEYQYDGKGWLIKKEIFAEGGSRSLIESFLITNTALGHPFVVIRVDEETKELINVSRFEYEITDYKQMLTKVTAQHSTDISRLLARMQEWDPNLK